MAVVFAPQTTGAPSLGTGSSAGLTANEVAVLNKLDIDYAMDQLYAISSMGEKIAGDENERLAQGYVYETMSDMLLDDVVMESFPTT
ncbi:MAG TPA: hypothetical protein ENN25_04915, partial [Euryarchaeota archaeon]|nr:hypothetical protein [Euryarchaeota archaeon]